MLGQTAVAFTPFLSSYRKVPQAALRGCEEAHVVRRARDRALVSLDIWSVPRQRSERRRRQRHRQSPSFWRWHSAGLHLDVRLTTRHDPAHS
jgi:hypothetical protein